MYGLPDAPRAWWEALTGYLKGLGFKQCRLDVAFLSWYHPDGRLGVILTLHVDDVMICGDGHPTTEAVIEAFHQKFPWGEWQEDGVRGLQ